jgi:hexosaminidase
MKNKIYWNRSNAGQALAKALKVLGEEYPLEEGKGAPWLEFTAGRADGEVEVSCKGPKTMISYGSIADALRGVGTALAGLADENKVFEKRPFTTFGIMLDCSRNAVMKVENIKRWLRRLALLGYNMVMLYTEDTYKIPGEPFFGFFRGAYSTEELKELDKYAAELGIEMIGCIQTLAHLEQILKWGAYRGIKDTNSVMLVGEPATYDLVRKMIGVFAECFRSRRIHVGMDEAWDLGRGQYINRFGYKREFEIFNEHLAKVIDICKEKGLSPMIWSDMYFRLGSKKGEYYDMESVIPDDVKAMIPKDVQLVYWDYYHTEEDKYEGMIKRHRDLGHEPVMASGVWTWARVWYDQSITERAGGPCVRAARKAGLKELFFTMWGDDGGYCEYESALAGLAWAAEVSYGGAAGKALSRRFRTVCGIDYEDAILGCALEDPTLGGRLDGPWGGPACSILWDDPLFGLYWNTLKAKKADYWDVALEHYSQAAKKLRKVRKTKSPVDMGHGYALAEFIAAKIALRAKLDAAYASRKRGRLKNVVKEAEDLADLCQDLEETFRRQWMSRNKPFGFEVVQARMGALKHRILEVARRVGELVKGRVENIPELDEAAVIPKEAFAKSGVRVEFKRLITPSSIL